MDLFRKKMISMPRNIMSFTCKQCRIVFHGDVKIAIVHLVLEHGQNVPQRNDFVFQCRICGPRALFDNERQLESHCKMHLDEVNFTSLQFHNSSLWSFICNILDMKTRKIIVCYNYRISAKFPKVKYEQIIVGILFAMILNYVVNEGNYSSV